MSEAVQNLVHAIQAGDALETENAFTDAMAEKLSTRLDGMRQSVAQSMFTQEEDVVQEEYEQIDEISTKTLASAAHSASDPDSEYSYGKSHDPQKFADHAKKTKDAKSAAAVQGAADAKGHYPRDNHTYGYDKLKSRTPSRVTSSGKANKQDIKALKTKLQN